MAQQDSEMPQKLYRYSHSELAQRVDLALLLIADDITILTEKRGVTAGQVADIAALNAAFKGLATDFYWRGEVTKKYAERNAKRKEIEFIINDLLDIAKLAFGDGSLTYNNMGFEKCFTANTNEFPAVVGTVITRITENAAAMEEKGMDAGAPAALATLKTAFDALLDVPENLENNVRRSKTKERIIKGNELYEAHKELCFAGSSYFRQRDGLRSKMYSKLASSRADGPGNPPEPVEDLTVENGIGSWSPVENATSYAIQVREPSQSGEWHTLVNSTTETQVTLPPQTGDYDVRVLARNAAGLSEPGNEVTVIVPAGLAPPSGVAYSNGVSSWSKSPGAAKTRIEASYDNGATYNEISETADEEYPWTPPSGHVILRFRCESADGSIVSSWVVLEVDIP